MSVRRLAALLPLTVILVLGSTLTSPAGAVVTVPMAPPPQVDTVTFDGQSQGPNHTWLVTAHWTASAGATGYRVKITDATNEVWAHTNVSTLSATLTVSDLLGGEPYDVSVEAFSSGEYALPKTDSFTAMELDTIAPNGTYTVAPTHAWLGFDFSGSLDAAESASVTITQESIADHLTAEDTSSQIDRRVLAGDGSTRAWASGTSLTLTYTEPGTYTPTVELSDEFGNQRAITLDPVTIAQDETAPVVTVTRPPKSQRDRIAAWRVVRGTATDTGTGVDLVMLMILQKRGGVWYAYHFGKHTWIKGSSSQSATLNHVKARPALMSTDSTGRWHTPRIRGLTTGSIAVHTAALDQVLNVGLGRVVRATITRS